MARFFRRDARGTVVAAHLPDDVTPTSALPADVAESIRVMAIANAWGDVYRYPRLVGELHDQRRKLADLEEEVAAYETAPTLGERNELWERYYTWLWTRGELATSSPA